LPGTAVRSIAAEVYRLVRDRRTSFGRRIEEASALLALIKPPTDTLLRNMGLYWPGDRLTSPKASSVGN
jgi:hypothetical protein